MSASAAVVDVGQISARAPNLHAVQLAVGLARVVVEQGDRVVLAVGIGQHGSDHLVAALPCSEHDRSLAPGRVGTAMGLPEAAPHDPLDGQATAGGQATGDDGRRGEVAAGEKAGVEVAGR